MAAARITSEPWRDAYLVLGLAVLALVAMPARVSALTGKDNPNFGYCISTGKPTTDLKTCNSKARRKPAPARAKRPFR